MAYFSDLSKKCELDGCRNHDFLPFKCEYCGLNFCEFHRKVQEHTCSRLKNIDLNKVVLCEYCDLVLPDVLNDINNYICKKCKKNFCLPHRYSDAHECGKEIFFFLLGNSGYKIAKYERNSYSKTNKKNK
ncbi:AN1-like zinc finger family protein, partial [Plasmodium malariae]